VGYNFVTDIMALSSFV